MSLAKLTIRTCEYLVDNTTGQHVYHVCDPHALVQAAGYLKYLGARDDETIYFRGQTRIYERLSPTLFRGCDSIAAQSRRVGRLNRALDDLRSKCSILRGFDEAVHEPLFQHYGLKTSWIDLVDNVWIALWFACHKARGTGTVGEFVHFERRSPHREEDPAYAYIAMIATDAPTSSGGAGHSVGTKTELVDLRLACPSVFLRPHAQHGVLFRVRGDGPRRPVDYIGRVRGTLRIGLADALSWLGDGQMLNVHALFPPPYYDSGYGILAGSGFQGDRIVGTIARICP